MNKLVLNAVVKLAMWLADHPDEVVAAVHAIKEAKAKK